MRRWQALALMGTAAAASLALIPIEHLIQTDWPVWQIRLALVAQPAVLIAVSIFVGERCTRRTGLNAPLIDAFLAGQSTGQVLRRQLSPALLVGGAAALLLVGYAFWVGPHVAPRGDLAAFATFEAPLVTKILYGGVGEEIITRWALLSLIALVALVIFRKPSPDRVVIGASVVLAALGFAAAHLPLLFLINPVPPVWIVAAVLAGNAIPGIGFGWLFWKYGLEAAMLAHITAHVVSTGLLFWMGGV